MRNWSDGSYFSAFEAPAIIAAEPLSPPIASMAIRGPPFIVRAFGPQASVETISRPL